MKNYEPVTVDEVAFGRKDKASDRELITIYAPGAPGMNLYSGTGAPGVTMGTAAVPVPPSPDAALWDAIGDVRRDFYREVAEAQAVARAATVIAVLAAASAVCALLAAVL